MAKKEPKNLEGISKIAIQGYKSIAEEREFIIRPLTILAGANSSGKSSAMQPLLLLKQTLEASYDPGPLLLNGPNVRFTSADQMLSNIGEKGNSKKFVIALETANNNISISFIRKPKQGFEIEEIVSDESIFKLGMSQSSIKKQIPKEFAIISTLNKLSPNEKTPLEWEIIREKCFFEISLHPKGISPKKKNSSGIIIGFANSYIEHIRRIIHVPGLRGNPERTYKTTAVGDEFIGTFENYVASVINYWQRENDIRLHQLSKNLEELGLTWIVEALRLDDTQVEIRVGRLKKQRTSTSNTKDLVNISDVGFGVSQTLPVLVALLVAQPGQLVYIEQPEIHLHPRAQSAMAQILADAAKRGVRVVIETHSSLLLRSIQTLVAEEYINQQDVILHWFKRRDDGITDVTTAELDELGAYGDWPEDFDDTILTSENRYLNAVEARLVNQ